MRATSGRARIATSLITVAIAMSAAEVNAQSSALVGQWRPDPGPSQLTDMTNGYYQDLLRSEVHSRAVPGASEVSGRAQSAAQVPKRRDSVLNGVLIGAGIGALLGLIPDYYDDCEECHDSLYASIAVGAGIGLVVDLLRTDTHAASPARTAGFRVGVAGSRRAVGVRGVFRW
jgi:hypothetical protein